MAEAAASQWWAWVIGNNDGGVGRERWSRGLDEDNADVGRGSSSDYAYEWTSLATDTAVCLHAHGIDNSDGGVDGERRALGLSDEDIGVGGGWGIDNTSGGSETTRVAAGDRRRSRWIYDNDKGIGGRRWERRLQERQYMRRQRIEYVSKGLETTTDLEADQRQAWWFGNDNGVLVLLAITLLTATLSCLCLAAVLFWYFFYQIIFSSVRCKKYYQYCNHVKYCWYAFSVVCLLMNSSNVLTMGIYFFADFPLLKIKFWDNFLFNSLKFSKLFFSLSFYCDVETMPEDFCALCWQISVNSASILEFPTLSLFFLADFYCYRILLVIPSAHILVSSFCISRAASIYHSTFFQFKYQQPKPLE